MDQQYPTVAKIPVLDTGKFEQWQFRMQQYLQHEHYALWEVIKFRDSCEAPANDLSTTTTNTTSGEAGTKSRRTVTLTTEDMQKKKNDAALLKTFSGNEATKKTKKNLLKHQYGNFRAEGSKTLEQTFTRLQVIIGQLQFMDVKVEQNDLNQKFLTSLAPEWLMHTIVWRNRSDLDTMSLDDLYNHLKVYETEVQKKMEPNTQNMVFISSAKHSRGNDEVNTASVYTASSNVPTSSANVATDWSYMVNDEEDHALVADEEASTEFALMANTSTESKVFDNSLCSKDCKKNNDSLNSKITDLTDKLFDTKNMIYHYKLALAQVEFRLVEYKEREVTYIEKIRTLEYYHESKKECIETLKKELETLKQEKEVVDKKLAGLLTASKDLDNLIEKCADDTVTDYSRPSPTVESSSEEDQNGNPSENVASPIIPKLFIKFVKVSNSQSKRMKGKAVKPSACWTWKPSQNLSNKGPKNNSVSVMFKKYTYIDTQGRLNGCSRNMTGNISYLSDYEPFKGGYVSFGQGGCKITGKGTIKTGRDFKLLDDANILLRSPRQHNMYSIDLNNIVPHRDITCLVAKASADKCMIWHRRLGHLNFKTMNKLVRHYLVRGLPTKCFENDHNCNACLKGKQHKSSCKSELVNSVSKPLHTLHMDLFGPTSVSSISHKWYCLVVTDDFSRCDNGGEFRNKELNDFCLQKWIKREFSNARNPQQNGVAERRNRVLVNKAHNKTPYELFNGKFEVKGDEGYFLGYSMSSKAFRVFNKRTKRVEENLHIKFLENKAIEKGAGPNWLFDIDSLTKSINYVPVVDAGTNSTNLSGTKVDARQDVKKDVSSLRYIVLPNWVHEEHLETSSQPQDACNTDAPESSRNSNPTTTSTNPPAEQLKTLTVETPIPTVSLPVPTVCFTDSQELSSKTRLISKRVTNQEETPSLDNILTLSNQFEDILRVTTNTEESNGVEADVNNMETTIIASPTPTFRIHRDHPKSQIISPLNTPIQTRNKSKEVGEQSFIAIIHQKTDPALLQFCLFLYFLSQVEPKNIFDPFQDPRVRPIGIKWILKNKKDERGIVIRNKARLVAQRHTQEEGIDYDEVFAPVARIEAIRLFLAHASFMGFTDLEYPARVYKVEKAMYGLHQAPRAWYDDIIFGSSNPQLCREFEALMHEKFQMSDMGELNFFFGLQVLQKEDGIFLSQDKYGKDGTGKDVDLHLYISMIGSLMYLIASRPDIMFAVCACVRHQVTPKECHLHAVKRIFRYLKVHSKLGLWYPKDSPFDLVAYSDSDHGGATQDRKSTIEGCQFLGRRLISWQCKKQTIVATSTTKAEYVAAASCCGQVLPLNTPFDAGRFQYLVCKLFPLLGKLSTISVFLGLELTFAGTSKYWGILRIFMIGLRLIPLGEGLGTPTNISSPSIPTVTSIPTVPIPTVIPSETTPIRQYTRRARIAQSSALLPIADEPASPVRDVSQGEACPTDSGFIADQDRATIAKSSTLPYDSAPRVTFPATEEGKINQMKERVKQLEEREGVAAINSGDDAPIKERSMDEGEAATERVNDDTEEMATVLTSIDASIVLASGVVDVLTGSGSIPTASTLAEGSVPTGSEEVPTTSPRRAEQIARDVEIARIHAEEELQSMIDGLDSNNETIAKYLEEYRWKAKDFKGMTFEEVEVKFNSVYKQMEDFIPMGSKEEAERIKRKGINLEQESAKKQKLSEEITEEAKSPEEVIEEKIKEMMQLDYPLRKGLALVMICYKLQVENYSQMADDLVRKIYNIANSPREQEEDRCHCQKDRTAINVKKKLPVKDGSYAKSTKIQFCSIFVVSHFITLQRLLSMLISLEDPDLSFQHNGERKAAQSLLSPNIEFMKPSGCSVTILNTLDHLGKFKGKDDDGILVGYSINNDKDADKAPGKGDEGLSKGSGIHDQERTDSSTQDVNTVGPKTGIFDDVYDDREVGAEANTKNLELSTVVRPIPTTGVHKDHPKDQIIRDLNLATQTRRMSNFFEENAMVSYINKQRRTNHKDYQNCLLASFLSQIEPNKTLVDLPNGKRAIGTKWICRNKKVERRIVVRNKARLVIIPKKKALIMMRVHCVPNGCKECLSVWHNRRGSVKQKDDGIFISQDKYVADILKKFDFTTTKTASTLMEPNKALIKDAEVSSYTKDFTSSFYEENLQIFKRKSTTGGCQFLGKRLISWQCKKQTIVVNSITEAEYVAAANCYGQVLWI
nr:hypothetical protein [Tanacetum cinerariifolium]